MRHQRRPQRIGAPAQPAEPQAERQHEDDVRRLDVGGGEGERAHDPGEPRFPSGRPPSHRAGRETPAPRPAAPGRPSRARLATNSPGSRATSIACFTPCGSMPSWLTAIDRTRATTVPSTSGRQPTGRKPSAGKAASPSAPRRRERNQAGGEEDGEQRQHAAVAAAARPPAPATAAGRPGKITIAHPRMGRKSFWINGLLSVAKPFDSLPGRPYTPAAQSVVPISTGSPFGELR